jgi:hypothetical protein
MLLGAGPDREVTGGVHWGALQGIRRAGDMHCRESAGLATVDGRPGRRLRCEWPRACQARVVVIGVHAVTVLAECGCDGVAARGAVGGFDRRREHAHMLAGGVEGAGVQSVQRADTCSTMRWWALLSTGVYRQLSGL